MTSLKKMITGATVFAMLGVPMLQAGSNAGYGYADSQRASYITPTVALGALTIAAVVAVLCMDRSSSGSNWHGDANSHS